MKKRGPPHLISNSSFSESSSPSARSYNLLLTYSKAKLCFSHLHKTWRVDYILHKYKCMLDFEKKIFPWV